MSSLLSLSHLKYGHALLQGMAPPFFAQARHNALAYFSHSVSFKNQHIRPEHAELGYRNLGHKEVFMLREQPFPSELAVCQELASSLHQLSLRCIEFIADELQLDSSTLFDLIDTNALPANQISSSLLRLLYYHGSEDNIKNMAGDIHEDLGLLTLVCHTGVPALEIYDFRNNQGWLDIEKLQKPDDIILMAGESLSLISNGYYIPATHRVRTSIQPRLSILYQLRCKQDAVLNSQQFENAVTGRFKKPFCMTGAEYLNKEISLRQSVHGSY